MGVPLVKCPKTGKMFSTGIQADAETVKNLREVQHRSRCPHCGTDHLWLPRDAVYADALAPAAWVENDGIRRMTRPEFKPLLDKADRD